MTASARVRAFLPVDKLVLGFFALLYLALFFGDGKQSVVEVYGVAVVLMMWIFRLSRVGPPIHRLPRPIAISWIFVFISTVISTALSESIGFSISWGTRLISAFLIYQMFYDMASARVEAAVSRSLCIFAVASTIASLIFGFFPWFQSVLPSMNLISRSYGHNHLADILVFVFPLVWNSAASQQYFRRAMTLIAYAATLLYTFARAAWIVVLGGIFIRVISLKKYRAQALVSFVLCVAVMLIVVLFGAPQLKTNDVSLQSYLRPKSVAFRIEYWNQARKGFMDRPIAGNGPGTFSLVSSRFQTLPLSASWFAHSQPLQLLAEQGMIGFLAFGGLFFSHGLIWYKKRQEIKKSTTTSGLVLGCILLVGYGFFEYVLDYYVIWSMLFAAAGIITGKVAKKNARLDGIGVKIGLLIIGVFYLLWVGSNGAALFSKKYDLAFYLAPFDAVQTLLYLDKNAGNLNPPTRSLVLFFHKGNPQILDALSKDSQKKGNRDDSLLFARRALYADIQNRELLSRYFSLLATSESEEIGEEMLVYLKHALPERFQPQVESLSPYSKEIHDATRDVFLSHEPLNEGLVSVLYLVGRKHLQDRPHMTFLFWNLAKNFHPDFAAIYIELAMYFQHVEHNDTRAQEVLRECMTRQSPRDQCRAMLGSELLPPGDYYEAIR